MDLAPEFVNGHVRRVRVKDMVQRRRTWRRLALQVPGFLELEGYAVDEGAEPVGETPKLPFPNIRHKSGTPGRTIARVQLS